MREILILQDAKDKHKQSEGQMQDFSQGGNYRIIIAYRV
jgi:hypothetical protein